MKIIVVVVTYNRPLLLSRALRSVCQQSRPPDSVFVISNSDEQNIEQEKTLCKALNLSWFRNTRTANYAGALNFGIEQIIGRWGVDNDLYFASLDDDDEWKENYLEVLESHHEGEDILFANITRVRQGNERVLKLPSMLNYHTFLRKNPGVGGSNTFVRLRTLLKSGSFDEAMIATVDRDIFTRLFQLNPSYKVISQNLVILYVDEDRKRVTTNRILKESSYRYFYYKYQHLMTEEDRDFFFKRAEQIFFLDQSRIVHDTPPLSAWQQNEITFKEKGAIQFIIGFIVGEKGIARRIIQSILKTNIPVDLLVIINNLPDQGSLGDLRNELEEGGIPHRIIDQEEWTFNLRNKIYGEYFSRFNQINSIPVGRTILQHHLYVESPSYNHPVFWIIDDDVTFSNTVLSNGKSGSFDIFEIIDQYRDDADAVIGSVSQDPPLPLFSCSRGQLVDLLYSSSLKIDEEQDLMKIRNLPDYYYDLTDAQSDHLECPIYYSVDLKKNLQSIFSGKAVSRPALQKKLTGTKGLVSNRGPNTLVFNRELLQAYPVVNLEIEDRFVRRGDLSWALMNQLFSKYDFVQHGMSLDQNRPISNFNIQKELDKSAHDIIGYAFNKALISTVAKINEKGINDDWRGILKELSDDSNISHFENIFSEFLKRRDARFLMNYYRIQGILSILNAFHPEDIQPYLSQFSDSYLEKHYSQTLQKSFTKDHVKKFLVKVPEILSSYSKSLVQSVELISDHKMRINEVFNTGIQLQQLGRGSEGLVFTDQEYVYKSFYSISDSEWGFLREKASSFEACKELISLEFREFEGNRFIRYPFVPFYKTEVVEIDALVSLLRFCRQSGFVLSNIKPSNFIMACNIELKYIDYGRSIEPFSEDCYINSVKRAFLFMQNPKRSDSDFQVIVRQINRGEVPREILKWKTLWNLL